MHDVAITGIGAVSALGRGLAAHADALRSGRTFLTPLRLFSAPGIPVALVGQVDDALLDPDQHGSRSDRLALTALADALAGARLKPTVPGVIAVGTTTGGIDLSERHYLKYRGLDGPEDRHLLRRHPAGAIADRLARRFALSGERHTFSTACSSSANAIGYAASLVAAGAPWAIAGGFDALCQLTYCGFYSLKLLSAAACKPFDRARVGMSLGEGAAFMVIESGSGARARGARPLAYLSGWGCTADAYHITAPNPEGRRAAGAIQAALADAQLAPEAVDYLNAHGTATPANDQAESAAIRTVFSGPGPQMSSTKGATGHTLGAAGALEAAICALVLSGDFAPSTVGLTDPDPALDVNHVPTGGRRGVVRTALSTSFGFGGNNAALVMTRGEA